MDNLKQDLLKAIRESKVYNRYNEYYLGLKYAEEIIEETMPEDAERNTNMADLIDRKELIKAIKKLMNEWKASPTKIYVCKVILSMLGDKKQIPPADTERHAHWILANRGLINPKCSNCGGYSNNKTQYCCSCGCRMDENTEGD